MKKNKLLLPSSQGKYKCKLVHDCINDLEVYHGKILIGSLWHSMYTGKWAVFDTVSVMESDDSRDTSKEDLLYFINCIDFLNLHAPNYSSDKN